MQHLYAHAGIRLGERVVKCGRVVRQGDPLLFIMVMEEVTKAAWRLEEELREPWRSNPKPHQFGLSNFLSMEFLQGVIRHLECPERQAEESTHHTSPHKTVNSVQGTDVFLQNNQACIQRVNSGLRYHLKEAENHFH